MLAGQSHCVVHFVVVKAMSRGALLLVILQLLLWLACCQDDSATVASQDASSSSYEGEEKNDRTCYSVLIPVFDVEEDWGDGLKVLSTFRPVLCEHKAKTGDVIHYHYVVRLGHDGSIFGRRY